MTTYTILVTDNYTPPENPLETNEAYVTFVLNMASKSYMNQYATANVEAGITAAREAYNASLLAPVEIPDAA